MPPSLAAVTSAGQQLLQQDGWGSHRHGAAAAASPWRPAECPRHPRGARPRRVVAGARGAGPAASASSCSCLLGWWWGRPMRDELMGFSPSWPPGPTASSSASLQTLCSHLNTGFCSESQGTRWLGLQWKAPQTEEALETSLKDNLGVSRPICLEATPRPSPCSPPGGSGRGLNLLSPCPVFQRRPHSELPATVARAGYKARVVCHLVITSVGGGGWFPAPQKTR